MRKYGKIIALISVLVILVTVVLTGCSAKTGLEKVKDSGKLTVLTAPGFAPFEYMNQGEICGVDIEICKKIAEKLGVEINIQAVDFDSIIPAVQSGKVDLGASGITATEERAKSVDFSINYINTGIYIIVPEGSDKIASKDDIAEGVSVGVQLGTTSDLFASNTGAEISRYKNVPDAVVALQSGKIDAVVADELPANDAVNNNPGLVLLEEPLTVEQYALATSKGNQELLDVVNEVLEEMLSSGELDALVAEHMELAAAATE